MRIVPELVSTIIPVYNRPKMLREAVGTVLAQTYRPIQIIIVDDGSTDDTPAVARSLEQEHPDLIKLVRQQNQGPGVARELGRQNAEGEFIQYLDSDDRLLPNKFFDQVACLKKYPDCGIAYGITRLIDEEGEVLVDSFKWTSRDIPLLFPALLVDRWWCTHTPLYRRSVTDAIGAWTDMRWAEDWEHDSRAGGMKIQLVTCHTAVSEHRNHSGDRLTSPAPWTTDPVRLRNRVRLLSSLWRGAEKAGVEASAPELQHFARWCFAIARQCAVQRMSAEMEACLALAERAAGSNGRGRRGIGLFRTASAFLGARLAGRLTRKLESCRSGPGHSTLPQSFS